jgi:hypothetical protein
MMRAAAVALVALGVSSAPLPSFAQDTKQACIDANERAQIDQRAGKLHEARRQLVFCANVACPAVVRSDCARLLNDVSQAMPTVVVDARDAKGAETTRVRMLVDGAVIAEQLEGTEVEVDPGEHTLRFEAAGGKTREQRLVLKEGDKRRRVVVDFYEAPPEDHAADVAQPSRTSAVPLILLLGVGALGTAGFATFGLVGYSQERGLASSCAPRCSDGQLRPVRTDYLLSDVSLGVAVAGLVGAGLYAWLSHAPSRTTTAWGIGAAPIHGGLLAAAQAGW